MIVSDFLVVLLTEPTKLDGGRETDTMESMPQNVCCLSRVRKDNFLVVRCFFKR